MLLPPPASPADVLERDIRIERLTQAILAAVDAQDPVAPPEIVAAAVSFLAACIAALDLLPDARASLYEELFETLQKAVDLYAGPSTNRIVS
jgi:hypothetical protein